MGIFCGAIHDVSVERLTTIAEHSWDPEDYELHPCSYLNTAGNIPKQTIIEVYYLIKTYVVLLGFVEAGFTLSPISAWLDFLYTFWFQREGRTCKRSKRAF